MTYTEKTFSIPALTGISEKTIAEHLKLYAGYVKHTNLIAEHIQELSQDSEKFSYELAEINRRFAFEFCGMKNHEYYFSALEHRPVAISKGGSLYAEIEKEWGSYTAWLERFKAVAMTRGVGWAMLSYDPTQKKLLTHWVDEQHLGQLTNTRPVLCLDMWEHSFVADYQPSGKKQYIEDFFANLNWSVVEKNYTDAAV